MGRFFCFTAICFVSIVFFWGCRSLPDVELGDCSDVSLGEFGGGYRFEIGGVLRYRYMLHWGAREMICNGVTEETSDGVLNIAGFADSGITLYSARWRGGEFEVLRNNMRMPDAVLSRSILSDLLLLYRRLPVDGDCVRFNAGDDSLWLKSGGEWGDGGGCFVLDGDRFGWGGIENGKVLFRAWVTEMDGDFVRGIAIENYRDGYSAEVAFLTEPDE